MVTPEKDFGAEAFVSFSRYLNRLTFVLSFLLLLAWAERNSYLASCPEIFSPVSSNEENHDWKKLDKETKSEPNTLH